VSVGGKSSDSIVRNFTSRTPSGDDAIFTGFIDRKFNKIISLISKVKVSSIFVHFEEV
jgi:hypothetical protein